jgi:hypothetical protein
MPDTGQASRQHGVMTRDEAQARHRELADTIRRHDRLYYVEARPEVSDREYDQLYQALLNLEREHPDLATAESPTQRVGGTPSDGFVRVTHALPMLSLEKIEAADHPTSEEEPDRDRRSRAQDERTLEAFRAFDETIRGQVGSDRVRYLMEPKVDGVSISVHYRHGKLVLGATRGDGRQGDDITTNLRTVRSIPLELDLKDPPALLEVRGEAYMATADFEQLNARLVASGEEPLPNARNATAGTLKQLDPKVVALRPVKAVFYAVGAMDGIHFESHARMLEQLRSFGLPVQGEFWVCDGIEEVLRHYRDDVVNGYDEGRDLRRRLPYEIDGVVLKVNDLAAAARIPGQTPGAWVRHRAQARAVDHPGGNPAQGDHRAGRSHGRSDSGGGARTGVRTRLHGGPGHAAQPGRDPSQGHPDRRHGGGAQGGHGDSGGGGGGAGASTGGYAGIRPRGACPGALPGVRRRDRSGEGLRGREHGSGLALCQHCRMPGATDPPRRVLRPSQGSRYRIPRGHRGRETRRVGMDPGPARSVSNCPRKNWRP